MTVKIWIRNENDWNGYRAFLKATEKQGFAVCDVSKNKLDLYDKISNEQITEVTIEFKNINKGDLDNEANIQ